ncbi:MAG TPA: tail fiber protein [Candidatus Sulfotelmatobacter sp.]|nr:tail fiber protein [Candidatus Sulfotelmatobacter sp.]
MGTPYVGEIRMFAGNFAPAGWAFCNGAQLAISENDVLFALIGTTYGGDGQTTFNLPDLQSRIPVHMGTGAGQTYVIGQAAGEETVTLTTNQIPSHNHTPLCNSTGAGGTDPTGGIWGLATNAPYATGVAPTLAMATQAIGPSGGSQPHDNMVPFLGINFIISLFGVFPSQT